MEVLHRRQNDSVVIPTVQPKKKKATEELPHRGGNSTEVVLCTFTVKRDVSTM